MKEKKWVISQQNEESVIRLCSEAGLEPLVGRILAARGICTAEQAEEYMDVSVAHIHDPYLLKDMDKAEEEIKTAIRNKVKIAVFGDYDVDGVTATCIMVQCLREMGGECMYYIPDRLGEGYGLSQAAILYLYEAGCRLLITVDSGITAVEETEYAKSLGMHVIITDHHECKDNYPNAIAVINPRRADSSYPFRELAGVGVAFKLICALEKDRGLETQLKRFGDLVAMGTVADVMPLRGENRIIVTKGLENLRRTKNLGLKALMQKLGFDSKEITANSVSFIMAPRINAAGRLGGAFTALDMFLTEDPDEATMLADQLCDLNILRQEEENRIYHEITARIEANVHLLHKKILVVWGDNWHNGVIGIVASRLTDRYGMPCVLISMDGDSGKGSGRSIKGFNLYCALDKNSKFLGKYGGHELAVGLSINRENLEQFRFAMEQYAKGVFEKEEIVSYVSVDCSILPEELTCEAVRGLSVLEPFGMGNPQPSFYMCEVKVEEITPISNERHMKMLLSKDGKTFFGFVFGSGIKTCPYVQGDLIDIVFSAEINNYRGKETVQLVIKDCRWSEREEKRDAHALGVYRTFTDGGEITKEQAACLSPTREELVAVFRHIKANMENGCLKAGARTLYRRVRYESQGKMNIGRFLICMDVFSEFSLFTYQLKDEQMIINSTGFTGKADINGSHILRRLIDRIKG